MSGNAPVFLQDVWLSASRYDFYSVAALHGYGKAECVHPLLVCWHALPSLLRTLLIIGGILLGRFTATAIPQMCGLLK